MRRALVAGVVATAMAVMPASSHAQAPPGSLAGCSVGEPFEVCFNDPTGDDAADGVLVDRLRQTIAAAKRGDRIRVAMYSWTLNGIATELARAKKRRADVRVVVDSASASGAPVRRMRRAKIPVRVCRAPTAGTSTGCSESRNTPGPGLRGMKAWNRPSQRVRVHFR